MSANNKITSEPRISPFIPPQTETARCAINEDGAIIYANDAFQALSGMSDDQGVNALEIFTFSNDTLSDHGISSLPTGEHDVHIGGNPVISEFHFDWLSTPDDRRILIASAIGDNALEHTLNSDLDALMLKIQTSTSRIEATQHAESVQPTLQDYEQFTSLSHDAMVIMDEQGIVQSVNDRFTEYFGYTQDSLGGLSFPALFNDDDRHYIRGTLHSLIHEDSAPVIDFEAQTLTQNGQSRWVEWKQKYVDGKIYAAGRDITDIKRKQDDLQRRQLQLSEAEAIGRMGHWHWLIGDDNISWSEEIFRIFGVEQSHFTPGIHSLSDLVHKRDLGRVVQVFQRAIIEEKDYDMEFRIVRPGGDVRFIMCEGRCEKDAEGEVIALYGIMQDMTERMLYEQELRAAKDASEQAYIAKSRFLANMSHELRTPLNAIIGFSEMIESQMLGPIFNEKYLEYATSIKDSGTHLLDLISDILDMSKIEAGKHTLDLESVNIKDIVDRATQMVLGHAQEQSITLRTSEIENSDQKIIGDRRALTQVVLNLLSNAIKFTNPHGSVWVECYPREEYLSLRICDTGIGIPPNKLASVLRPFEQASSEYTRDHEGTGLGLSITKELVELHGGALLIESTVDVGTTVTIRLPYEAKA